MYECLINFVYLIPFRAHIPYRDSKLTRILQTALGGNARTAIICTMTPDEVKSDLTNSVDWKKFSGFIHTWFKMNNNDIPPLGCVCPVQRQRWFSDKG